MDAALRSLQLALKTVKLRPTRPPAEASMPVARPGGDIA
jgi:hypothetical protein